MNKECQEKLELTFLTFALMILTNLSPSHGNKARAYKLTNGQKKELIFKKVEFQIMRKW